MLQILLLKVIFPTFLSVSPFGSMPEIINQEQQTQSHRVYLNIIYNGVPEIEAPPVRWPYQSGYPLIITYRWHESINVHREWFDAFSAARDDWDEVSSPVDFVYNANSKNYFGVEYDPNTPFAGYTIPRPSASDLEYVEVIGNLHWDEYYNFTVNQRQSTASHEIGHMQRLGHVPRDDYPKLAIMWDWRYVHEKEWQNHPYDVDITLINQVYP